MKPEELTSIQLASSVYEKHKFISEWLISLGVSPDTASADACEMEHNISDESFKAMKKFIQAKTDK